MNTDKDFFIQKKEGYISRQKEFNVIQFIIKTFPELKWNINDPIENNEFICKPDLRLDMKDKMIFIEIDENQHKAYDQDREIERLLHIHNEIYLKNVFFIRFNPDAFICNDEKYNSCWKYNDDSKMCLYDNDQWTFRLNILKDTIINCMNCKTSIPFEIIYLFYDRDSDQIKKVKQLKLLCKDPEYKYDKKTLENTILENKKIIDRYKQMDQDNKSELYIGQYIIGINNQSYEFCKGGIITNIIKCKEYDIIEYRGSYKKLAKIKTNEYIIYYRDKSIRDEDREYWKNNKSPLEKLKSLKRQIRFIRKQLKTM